MRFSQMKPFAMIQSKGLCTNEIIQGDMRRLSETFTKSLHSHTSSIVNDAIGTILFFL